MNNRRDLFQGERSTYAEFSMQLTNSLIEKSVYSIATNSQPRPLDLQHAPWHDMPENVHRLHQAQATTSRDQIKWDAENEKAWSIIMNSLHPSLRLRFQAVEPMRASYLFIQLRNRYGGNYDVDQIAAFKVKTTIACRPTNYLRYLRIVWKTNGARLEKILSTIISSCW
jgi:hypothetical protein